MGSRIPPTVPLERPMIDTDEYYATDWRLHSACRDEDPELFFPVGSARLDSQLQIARAKEVCLACPVLNQCRAWALQPNGPEYGIFGGLDEDQRRAIRRPRYRTTRRSITIRRRRAS
jgi:WhiB family redox-sensing transcriptional regulator